MFNLFLAHIAGIKLHLLGRGKVHWSKKKGKERVHYRAEEIYFNDVMLLFGDCK